MTNSRYPKFATIGHVDHGKTSLTAAIALVLTAGATADMEQAHEAIDAARDRALLVGRGATMSSLHDPLRRVVVVGDMQPPTFDIRAVMLDDTGPTHLPGDRKRRKKRR